MTILKSLFEPCPSRPYARVEESWFMPISLVHGFPNSLKGWGITPSERGMGGFAGGLKWWEPEEKCFWPFKSFSKLKTTFCKYWRVWSLMNLVGVSLLRGRNLSRWGRISKVLAVGGNCLHSPSRENPVACFWYLKALGGWGWGWGQDCYMSLILLFLNSN